MIGIVAMVSTPFAIAILIQIIAAIAFMLSMVVAM